MKIFLSECWFSVQRFLNILRVRMIYWWWIVKYGGKKNIPPEIIMAAVEKSMEEMIDAVGQAFRLVDETASEEEKELAKKAFEKVHLLRSEIANMHKREL